MSDSHEWFWRSKEQTTPSNCPTFFLKKTLELLLSALIPESGAENDAVPSPVPSELSSDTAQKTLRSVF